MLFLKELQTDNFKNLKSVKLSFTGHFTCFAGNNGAGKTNLIDAIYYLSIGKSYFQNVEINNIFHNENYFNLKGTFLKDEKSNEIFCGFMSGNKKKIKRNGTDYEKISDHVGEFPVVITTPNDGELISGNSEERRRFLDSCISQLNKNYLENLIRYNRNLQQRNAHLKQMFETNKTEDHLIGVYDYQMIGLGESIFKMRKEIVTRMSVHFAEYYQLISGKQELAEINYLSQLNEADFSVLIKEHLKKDILLQRSTIGIHKDDLEILINGYPARKFASQGQIKSTILALKLAQFRIIWDTINVKPILLLDDIFDRLDRDRITRMMDILANNGFGQVFLTDTNEKRVKEVFKSINIPISVFEIDKGNVTENFIMK